VTEIVIYTAKDGHVELDVSLADDTVWLSVNQMVQLFGRDKSVISRHLNNIFKIKELEKNSVVANFATTAADGKTYQVDYYNLDAILSVGYRVNSKEGVQFRKWASQVLNDLGQEAIQLILTYTKTWDLLLAYDEGKLKLPTRGKETTPRLNYQAALSAIESLKIDLSARNEATPLFGHERQAGLDSILNNIEQTFGGEALYKTAEEKAAHLLYFVIKDHPFTDGNKRIGSFMFLLYLKSQSMPIKLNDNGLVALALLVAESDPNQKEMIVRLIVNLLID